MRRDDDMLRDILLEMEAYPQPYFPMPSTLSMSEEKKIKIFHMRLLVDQGLVSEGNIGVYSLTNKGHDYLRTIHADETTRGTCSVPPRRSAPTGRRDCAPPRNGALHRLKSFLFKGLKTTTGKIITAIGIILTAIITGVAAGFGQELFNWITGTDL